MAKVRLIFIGDIVGNPGRRAVRELLPGLREREGAAFVVANGENVAGGKGITKGLALELLAAGVDVLTTGNHVWQKRDVYPFLDSEPRLLRPANYPEGSPGRGHGVYDTPDGVRLGVLNLQGRVFMQPIDCPFRAADALLEGPLAEADLVLCDIHAEATSEKVAMGRYLDGRATLVVGTHTHVQTADECVLPGGTGYITDAGMTGPLESVIGARIDRVLPFMVGRIPRSFDVAKGPVVLQGVVAELDGSSGRTVELRRIRLAEEKK